MKIARRRRTHLRPRCAATCQLADGEKAHLANYCACKHAKEEMGKKKPQVTPRIPSGRVFSSKPVKPNLSFEAALRGQAVIQPQQEAAANSTSTSGTKANVQATGQSIQAPNVNSGSLDMIRAFSVVEQIMAELKGAACEEAKFVALAKIVFKFIFSI
jgi:hypothetical protein